jgi:hypothetical protein
MMPKPEALGETWARLTYDDFTLRHPTPLISSVLCLLLPAFCPSFVPPSYLCTESIRSVTCIFVAAAGRAQPALSLALLLLSHPPLRKKTPLPPPL